MRHVKQSVQSSFGEYGFAQVVSSLQGVSVCVDVSCRCFYVCLVKYWNATTNCYILRVAREYVQLLWSALILITRIDGRAVVFRVMHVSGTMKNVQDKAARLLTEAQRQQQQL
jgi:RNase P/RNase MRP subunit POP5